MEAPTCPYCSMPWNTAMLEELKRYSDNESCLCCSGGHVERSAPAIVANVAKPSQDLCCHSCGKPIYRAPNG